VPDFTHGDESPARGAVDQLFHRVQYEGGHFLQPLLADHRTNSSPLGATGDITCNLLADWPQQLIAILLRDSCSKMHTDFYRATLCIRGRPRPPTSHGPVSVCPSVISRCSTKTAKRRITQTTPHDSPGTLVCWRQRSPRNRPGSPATGAPNAGGVGQNRRLSTNNRLYLENGTR